MPAPPALTGKRRAEAKRLIAAHVSDREIARKFGVDHKVISRLRKTLERSTEPKPAKPDTPDAREAPTPPHREPRTVTAEELEPEQLLDDDLRLRLEVRNRLRNAMDVADEPRDLTALAKELGACLDGIRRVLTAKAPEDDDEEDIEAEAFDAYMLRLVAKGRVVVNASTAADADAGVSIQAESAGEVGDRAGANGTDG